MKPYPGKQLEACRITHGWGASDRSFGFNGAFVVPVGASQMRVICSDGMGWEHVSVSLPDRCPTWDEMCLIKALFWDEHECVVQYHPPKSAYVNQHPFCLHLWKPTQAVLPQPPAFLIGTLAVG